MSCSHDRRTKSIPPCLAIAIVLVWATSAIAQEPVRAFDQLDTRLKVGDTVWITTAQGTEVKGKVENFAGGRLKLRGQNAPFEESNVVSITQRPHDSLKWGAVIGLCIGGMLGVVGGAAAGDAGTVLAAGALYGGLGAAIGAGIDAMVPMPKQIVYRAPGPAKGSRLSVAPFLTPTAKGVRASFAF